MVVEFGPDAAGWLIFGYVVAGAVLLAVLVVGVVASVRLIRGRPVLQRDKRTQRHVTVSALVILVGLLALSVGLGGMTPAFGLFLLLATAILAVALLRDRRSP